MSLSTKRSAYSDMPSFSSQSAICCIAAPYGFNAIRSGPAGQKVYDTRQPIVSSSSRERCLARKNNSDLGELAGLRIDLDRTRMLFHDNVVSDGQAKPGALSWRLRCEEGIEHLFPNFMRNAAAVVANSDIDFVAEALCRRH